MSGVTTPRVPAVYAAGQWWSADQVEAMAASWLQTVDTHIGEARPCAIAMPSSVEGVALFVAASARTPHAVLISHDPRFWPKTPGRLSGLTLVLPPSVAHLAPQAEAAGFVPLPLSEPGSRAAGRPIEPFRAEGFVVFTSGSTGAPKPVFRPASHVLAGVQARLQGLGLRPGEGVISGVSLASGHGLVQVATSMLLGAPFGIVNAVDHREALAAIARPQFGCWRVTPHFADLLGRCALTGPAVAPPICLISSPISRVVFDRFLERFGVPLRQTYSSSETAVVAVDGGPAGEVVFGTVGHALPGVEVVAGERPDRPAAEGTAGRLWVRSRWQMAGYGIPPDVERPGDVNGWWPTRDVGSMDSTGRLTLHGRLDDCVRTREGRLVNLEAVAELLRSVEGVIAAVVVPLAGDAGATFGAVMQAAPGESLASIRPRLAGSVPSWALPRRIIVLPDLPRLATGKPDRLSCLSMLSGDAVLV